MFPLSEGDGGVILYNDFVYAKLKFLSIWVTQLKLL